jgi:hypothetical protein
MVHYIIKIKKIDYSYFLYFLNVGLALAPLVSYPNLQINARYSSAWEKRQQVAAYHGVSSLPFSQLLTAGSRHGSALAAFRKESDAR